METTLPPTPPHLASQHDAQPRLQGTALASVAIALLLMLLLEALDQTVVGTALPRIIGSLHGFDRYIWAGTAYTLASTIVIPIVGALSDQFGRKWFLVAGTILFLLGSMLAGAAQTMNSFIAFRALQGMGAGVGIALAFVVIADVFPPAERAKWQSLFGVVYGFSSLVGPTLGGWLSDHGPLLGALVTDATRWRWVFYINLPVGLIALAAVLIYLPANLSVRGSNHTGWAALRRIDFLGGALVTAATVCLMLGLTWGSNQVYAWDAPQVVGILIAAAVLYVAFVIVERFAAEPILPLNLFRNQVFAVAVALSLLQITVLVALVVFLPLYLQGVLGVSATNAGVVVTPLTFSSVISASLAGIAVARFQRYQAITILSALVMCVGVYLLTRLTPTTGSGEAAVYMVLAGLGLGTFFSVLTMAAQNALPPTRLGVGTSTLRYMSQLGGVLGIAIVGAVVNNALSASLTPRLARIPGIGYLPPDALKAATDPQVLVNDEYRQSLLQHVPAQFHDTAVPLFNQIFEALRQALATAIVQGLVAVLVIAVLALLCTLLLKDIPFRRQAAPDASAGQAHK